MGNPRPDLQGFADPSIPGWRERAIARVAERAHTSRRKHERRNGMYILFDDPLRVLLDEAARRRDISLTAYARRAMIAFISHDLNMKIEEVAEHAALPVGYGATGNGSGIRTKDTGRTRGPWIITGLRE